MLDNDFRQPISVDFAPQGSLCEWCGKPAVHQLTALGGKHHNEGGLFCRSCGEEFARTVAALAKGVADVTIANEQSFK